MFINKIGNSFNKPIFKGYQHALDTVGNDILRFNYPFDYEKEICEIQIFKVESLGKGKYKLIEEPICQKELQQGGTDINLQALTDLDKDAPFAYRYVRKSKETGEIISINADSGVKINADEPNKNIRLSDNREYKSPEYTLVTRIGTTPKIQGAGYLGFPDSQRVGYFYKDFDEQNTGEIYFDKNVQKNMESVKRTFSNKFGGNLAGLEHNIDYLSELGIKVFFACPIAGGDNKSSHHYWNKNNFQISDDVGNTENFNSFTRKLFQKGITYVYDGTFTSEGLEGIHFQYAMRWADRNPQSYYWFRMSSLKDTNLGLGAIPKHKENLRFRLINAPKIWDQTLDKAVENIDYNPNKETYIQIYDGSQVTEEQLSKLDQPINIYEKIKSGNLLDINSHDNTLINYICQVDPKEVNARFDAFEDFNKNNPNPIKLNSPDGTILFSQFSNFKFDKKTEGGFVAWDANTDMAKMNYHISGYDEKINQAIADHSERDFEKIMQQRGAFEVQDMTLQAGRYWTSKVKDTQNLYSAQVLKGAKTEAKIQELINNGLLPKEAALSQTVVDNIINGYYKLEPKGNMRKDVATVKALMKMPLDSLEFAENTVGVLSTSYFSNRATSAETLGKTRFELLEEKNPHLVEPYKDIYSKITLLYLDELKDFAHEVIKKVDKTSTERLLDEHEDYTEYGEYVIELLASSIAKYALLKSLTGKNLKTKILPNGEITYDYANIKEITTLKTLGINAVSPEDEAEQLYNLIEKGIRKLNSSDIEYVAKSITKSIEGTNVNSFRLAEAIVRQAGLGLSWRLDAAKDVIDQDAVRNGDTHFDESWQNVIDFWKQFVQQVKKENPHSYIVAEITDMGELMSATNGEKGNYYDNPAEIGNKFLSVPDAMIKFFNETGITSEAAYSYFFTDLLRTFSADFEEGKFYEYDNRSSNFIWKVKELIDSRGVDFVRNLFTFAGNHDKPRILHGLSLDMGLFHANLGIFNKKGELNFEENRKHRLEAMLQLTNSDSIKDLPLEAMLNLDNPEYFNTVSTKAVAMSQLLRSAINETLPSFATKDEIEYLKLALVDLTNGNFGDIGTNTQIHTIKIEELASLENALRYLLKDASINLSEQEVEQILEKARDPELIEKYQVQGDFDWSEPNAHIGQKNRDLVENILRANNPDIPSGEWDYKKYSLYAVSIAGLLRESFLSVKSEDTVATENFFNAQKNFITKFNRKTVEESRTKLPQEESSAVAMAKNGYAALNIKASVEMLIKQAEFRARKAGKLGENEHFANTDKIWTSVYQNATESGVQKAIMMYAFLEALVGIPTLYGGDELGMTGWEEKAKNIYLQNRNALPWSELEEGLFKDIRQRIHKEMKDVIGIRSREGVQALSNGTAYMLRTNSEEIPAYLMQDAYGNMTISVFNATDIDPKHRVDYFEKFGINEENKKKFFEENDIESINPDNRFVPIQRSKEIDYIELGAGIALPVGLTFMNSDLRDKAVYVVERVKDKLRIVSKSGKFKISSKGVTVLKHVAKPVFKGGSKFYNKQYNIVSNPYRKTEAPVEGEKLSILAK